MIHDLKNGVDGSSVRRETPVCIIGAGTAGLFLAQRLRGLGIPVIVLEAGDRQPRSPAAFNQQCEQRGITYRGAEVGRAFGLGGTSVLWGGQFIPVTPGDIASRPIVGFDAWPVEYADLGPFFDEVREVLGFRVPPRSGIDEFAWKRFPELNSLDDDFTLRVSEWLPFKRRNFAKAFTRMVTEDRDLELWLNTTVTELVMDDSGTDRSLRHVRARSANGKDLLVCARYVVISAGALESTRLLLALDESLNHGITHQGPPLGRYFSDHLSVTVGRFRCNDWNAFNHAVAPVFQGGIMRTPRLELSASVQAREELTSAFAHFTFLTHGNSGFDVVRNWLRKRQGEGLNIDFSPATIVKAARDVVALGFWKTAHRRLWIPRDAELYLQVDIEQFPNPDSRLTLTDERDEYGRKRLAVDWRIRPDDVRVIRVVAEKVAQAWQASSLNRAAELVLQPLDDLDDFSALYDVYHPTGTLRMGTEPENSVVDRDLRLWSFANCYVSSTAVFPSAGSANPGYTHLALTARLARHLGQRLD